MKTLSIYGASDDLVEMDGIAGADEFGAYKIMDHDGINAQFLLTAGGQRMRIYAIYDGCWMFALGQVDEDDPMPLWPTRRSWEGYSEHIEIDLPDDAVVIHEKA